MREARHIAHVMSAEPASGATSAHSSQAAADRRALHSAGRELSDVSENRTAADSHTGDAQPEHATGGWGVVIHPLTTLVSRAGQVCVSFKI